MKVCFLDQFSELGGAQQCLLDLLPAVAERGWTASVAIPGRGPLDQILRKRGIRVENIPGGQYRCGTKTMADAFRFAADVPMQASAISRLLDSASADLVYVNGPRMLAGAALAVRGRVPILFHAHHAIEQRIAADLEGFVLRKSLATIAACCEAVRQPFQDWVPPDRIHTIPNGSPDLGFRERTFQQPELRIGIIGRIAPDKGQAEFLRAAALIAPLSPRLRFVICGSQMFAGDAYYRQVLKLASGLPVEFLGWQDDVGAVIHDLDILVLASKREGLPRVILEAFSAGLTVLAPPVGGIPEAVEEGFTGFLAHSSGPEALAAKLREVLQINPVRLRTIARNARKQWERHYTLATYRDRITTLMERCVGLETVPRQARRPALLQ